MPLAMYSLSGVSSTVIPVSLAMAIVSAPGCFPRTKMTRRISSMSAVRITCGLIRPVSSAMCSLGKASTSLIISLAQAQDTSKLSSQSSVSGFADSSSMISQILIRHFPFQKADWLPLHIITDCRCNFNLGCAFLAGI